MPKDGLKTRDWNHFRNFSELGLKPEFLKFNRSEGFLLQINEYLNILRVR